MPAWPNDDLVSDELDLGTDNPQLARPQIYALLQKVQAMLAARNDADGVCGLGANGVGTAGQMLISNGPSNSPSFQGPSNIPANFQRLGQLYLYTGAAQLGSVPMSGFGNGVWNTYGPVGSGAQRESSALDFIPNGATGIRALLSSYLASSGTSTATGEYYARPTGSTQNTTFPSPAQLGSWEHSGVAGERFAANCRVDIPLNSSRMFDFLWSLTNTSNNSCSLTPIGFWA